MTAYSIAWKPLIHILHPPITQTLLLLSDDKTSLLVHRFEYVFTSFRLSTGFFLSLWEDWNFHSPDILKIYTTVQF